MGLDWFELNILFGTMKAKVKVKKDQRQEVIFHEET
jgi:hypothetical protein